MNIFQRGSNFDSNKGEKKKKWGETKGDNGFRGRPSHHWMMVSIQASVSGFHLISIGIFLSIFANFMLALIVLSSTIKKGEIVWKMAPLGYCFVILVIE
jgi:hypothetical protein